MPRKTMIDMNILKKTIQRCFNEITKRSMISFNVSEINENYRSSVESYKQQTKRTSKL